jgi:hypothetical protein
VSLSDLQQFINVRHAMQFTDVRYGSMSDMQIIARKSACMLQHCHDEQHAKHWTAALQARCLQSKHASTQPTW